MLSREPPPRHLCLKGNSKRILTTYVINCSSQHRCHVAAIAPARSGNHYCSAASTHIEPSLEALESKDDREEFLGGSFALTKVERGGVEFNLAKIFVTLGILSRVRSVRKPPNTSQQPTTCRS